MDYYSRQITRLIEELSALPGIGKKSAQRLAFHIISMPEERVNALAEAMTGARKNIRYCRECYTLTDDELCPICRSTARNHRQIMVVENTRDLAAYEKKWIRESDVTYLFNPEEQKALSGYGSVRCVPHGVNGALFTYEKDHAAELEAYLSAGGAPVDCTKKTVGGAPVDGAGKDENGAPLENAVVFMGKMNYQPNVDAALWYLKNVHPKIADRIPFVIVGAYPTEEVRKAAAGLKNVTVTGFVEDPYVYVSAAMAAVAPMQSGGGIQNKVLESMALGKVNLVSPLAAAALEGLENGCCAGERVMYICRTPEEYAKRLSDMAEKTAEKRSLGRGNETGHADEIGHVDETGHGPGFSEYENVGLAAREYENVGRSAREYIRRHYTWEKYGEAYLKGIEGER